MKGRIKLRQMTPVEIIVTYISIGWAFVMFSNPDALVGSWQTLNDIANRYVFGGIALISALIKIIGISLDDLKLRTVGLTLSAFYWTFISVANLVSQDSFSQSFSISTGFIVYSGVAVLCLWTSKEINHDRRK